MSGGEHRAAPEILTPAIRFQRQESIYMDGEGDGVVL